MSGSLALLRTAQMFPMAFAMLHGAQLAIDDANDRGGYSDQCSWNAVEV
jgi:hypothetical protein